MQYDASSIRVLKGLEPVRLKPGMYVGALDEFGLYILIKELMDNSGDELRNGFGDAMHVWLSDNTFTVSDNGRGIPAAIHPIEKVSALQLALCVLHAGGKMTAEDNAYEASAGTHGLGVSITNALSSELVAFTYRDKKWHYLECAKGKPLGPVSTIKTPDPYIGKALEKGTCVSFIPDRTMFSKDIKMNVKRVQDYMELMSYFLPKATLYLHHDKKTIKYHNPRGLPALLEKLCAGSKFEPAGQPVTAATGQVTLCMQWCGGAESMVSSYVCASPTVQGGTHLNGLLKALYDTVPATATQKKKFEPEDLLTGFVGVLNVNIASPNFGGQTKHKLTSKEATTLVYDAATVAFKKFFRTNKDLVKEIIQSAIETREFLSDSKKARELAAAVRSGGRGKNILPPKLAQAPRCKPSERELYLVEGDSAGGSAKKARNSKFQEVLPLRGKVLNVFKDDVGKAVKSQAIIDILKSTGYDPKEKDPYSKLRVGKIILLCDPDEDGYHISLLVLGVFQRFLPELFKRNMIHVVSVPLYSYSGPKGKIYADKLKQLKTRLGDKFNPAKVTRMKGWGECDHKDLKPLCMDVNSRKLIRIGALKDKDEHKAYVAVVGENSDARKRLLGI